MRGQSRRWDRVGQTLRLWILALIPTCPNWISQAPVSALWLQVKKECFLFLGKPGGYWIQASGPNHLSPGSSLAEPYPTLKFPRKGAQGRSSIRLIREQVSINGGLKKPQGKPH